MSFRTALPSIRRFPRLRRFRRSPAQRGRLLLEPLEERRLLALVGVLSDFEFPNVAYDNSGTVSYTASTDSFQLRATPLTFDDGSTLGFFVGAQDTLSIDIQVDDQGNLVGGVAGDDLVLSGDLDTNGDFVPDLSGVLLTGEVTAFGFRDAGSTDEFDFRFTPTGGTLASSFFGGKDIGVFTASEQSTFTGFTTDFGGGAKGNLAPIPADAEPSIDLEKFVRVDQVTAAVDIEKFVKVIDDQTGGGEGLTPGFWKQSQHFDAWTTFAPEEGFNDVFGVNDLDGPTLLEALERGGGGLDALGRHATAALLNAASPNIDYAFSTADIVSAVQAAYADPSLVEQTKDAFAVQNELGADLSTASSGSGDMTVDIGVDADEPTGPVAGLGDKIMFTYLVTNPGDVGLTDVAISDDNATPEDPSDDLVGDPVEEVFDGESFNVGDLDHDRVLDPGEQWVFTAMITAEAEAQYVNWAVVTALDLGGAIQVRDDDPGHYLVGDASTSSGSDVSGDSDGPVGSEVTILSNTDSPFDPNNIGVDADTAADAPEASLGDKVTFTFVATNNGDVELAITDILDDNETPGDPSDDQLPEAVLGADGFNFGDEDNDGLLDPGETFYFQLMRLATDPGLHTDVGKVSAETAGGQMVMDDDPANFFVPFVAQIDVEKFVKIIDDQGLEGLTPGFWKQSQHFDAWVGFDPSDSYNTVFGVGDPDAPTLLEALERGGGSFKALGRHAVAALLNAANPNVNYALTVDQIKNLVQDAFASGTFEAGKEILEAENERGADLSDGGSSAGGTGFGQDADDPTGPVAVAGGQVMFTYVITNPGDVELASVVVTDDNQTPEDAGDDFNPDPVTADGFNVGDLDQDGRLDPGETWLYTSTIVAAGEGQHVNVAVASGTPVNAAGEPLGDAVADDDPAHWLVITQGDQAAGEGLTPGFWKTHSRFGPAPEAGWPQTGFDPQDLVDDVFMLSGVFGDTTLLEALQTGGGGVSSLMRHAVAALLNAAHPNIDYAFTVDEVKQLTGAALATGGNVEATKNMFEEQNQLGADLDDGSGPVTLASSDATGSISGRVYHDLNHNGSDDGEPGIAGVSVRLVDEAGNVVATVSTDADGNYQFAGVAPGTYTIVEGSEATEFYPFADGEESLGNLGGSVADNDALTVLIDPGDDAAGYAFGEIQGATVQGLVWEDADGDGQIDVGEQALEGVTVKLTGINDRGETVSMTATTDVDGVYVFTNLRPSDAGGYTVEEIQPEGVEDGQDLVGMVLGSPVGFLDGNDRFSGIVLGLGQDAEDYNFAEASAEGSQFVSAGQTATIGFWKNRHGQKLIRALNGGPEATDLGNWLAANFPNLYGADAGENNLQGKTNHEIAKFFKDVFKGKKLRKQRGSGAGKLDPQVLAVALASYVTSENLAGTVAQSYGFETSASGVGSALFDIDAALGEGTAETLFGAGTSSVLTVLDILSLTDENSTDGIIFDDGDGSIDWWEKFMRSLAEDLFAAINEAGSID